MSTADEDWAEGKFGELYTTEQIGMIMTAVQNQTCPFQKQAQIKVAEMEPMNENTMEKMSPNHEVEMWIPMAEEWLKEILMI